MSCSVVIPCYGVASYVAKAVESLLEQESSDWEGILVDDGSPDDIYGAIRRFLSRDKRLKYIKKQNGGVASARNHGFRHASPAHEYVMFLDGDDVLKPTAIGKMMSYLDRNAPVGMVHCEAEVINEGGGPSERNLPVERWTFGVRELSPTEPVTPFESIYTLSFLIPSVCMLRKSMFGSVGGFDESFGHNMEDTDFHLRIALRQPVHFLPEKLVKYRIRPGQASSDLNSLKSQAEKLWAKWRADPRLGPSERELVDKAENFRTNELAVALGLRESRRYLKKGEWLTAARFWQGAVRRRMRTLVKCGMR